MPSCKPSSNKATHCAAPSLAARTSHVAPGLPSSLTRGRLLARGRTGLVHRSGVTTAVAPSPLIASRSELSFDPHPQSLIILLLTIVLSQHHLPSIACLSPLHTPHPLSPSQPSSRLMPSSDCEHPPACPAECHHCLAYDRHTRSLCSRLPASQGSKWCAIHEELQVSPRCPASASAAQANSSTRVSAGQGAQVVQASHSGSSAL